MLFYNVGVRGHKLVSAQAQILASGSVGADCVHFEFDDEWVGLAKIALFWGEQDEPFAVTVDINSNALIPWEVLDERRRIKFGVYGIVPGQTTPRITSTLITVQVPEGAWSDSILNPGTITPTIIEQFVAEASAAITGSVRYDGPQTLTTAQIIQARANIDAASATALAAEVSARQTTDNNLAAEVSARQTTDSNLAAEVSARQTADTYHSGDMGNHFDATRAYSIGEFFTRNNLLYYVQKPRAAGAWSDSDVGEGKPFIGAALGTYVGRTAGITAHMFDPTANYAAGDYVIYDYHLYQFTAAFSHTGSFPATGIRRAYLGEDVQLLQGEVDDLKSALNAMYPVTTSGQFEWTLGKTVNSSGVYKDNASTATTSVFRVNPSNGLSIFNACNAKGMNDFDTVFHVNEYVDGVWQARHVMEIGKNVALDASTNGVRLTFGYALSTGVVETQEDIDANFAVLFIATSATNQDIAAIQQDILENYSTLRFDLRSGSIDDSDGSIVPSVSWVWTNYLPLDNVTDINVHAVSGSKYNAFYDSEKSFISSFRVVAGDNTVVIPQDAAYVALSGRREWFDGFVIRVKIGSTALNETVDTLVTETEALTSAVKKGYYYLPYNLESGSIDKDDGSILPSETWRWTGYLSLDGVTNLSVHAIHNSLYNAFYDSEEAFIKSFRVVAGDNTVAIPQDAAYVAFSTREEWFDGFTIKCYIAKGAITNLPFCKIRIMQHNLGCFRYGRSPGDLELTDEELEQKIKNYKRFYGDIRPDIIGVQEYVRYIGDDSAEASETLYDPLFAHTSINRSLTGKHPAIWSNLNCIYASEKSLSVTVDGVSSTWRYAEALLEYKNIRVVSCAPASGSGDYNKRTAQYEALFTLFDSESYGIICIDMNVWSEEEFEERMSLAEEHGFHSAANGAYWGSYDTYIDPANQSPLLSYYRQIDNILVKGDMKMVNAKRLLEESTDFPADFVFDPADDPTPDKSKTMVANSPYNHLASDHIPIIADLVIY